MSLAHLIDRIFNIQSHKQFDDLALELFRYQYKHIGPYREFCQHLKVNPSEVNRPTDIPFLPIELFKSQIIKTDAPAQQIFSSSGTTGSTPSLHHVVDLSVYQRSFQSGFEQVYGPANQWVILALLPSYLQRDGSSLVYMVNRLIKDSGHSASGFYLHDHKRLKEQLQLLEAKGQKTILLGVSYALLDLIEQGPLQLKHTTIMETGGMKGRRKELIKSELHDLLKRGFGVETIHSEYGMTELLSQAYSKGGGIYDCPPWMRVLTRDPEDPRSFVERRSGGINVIDLANVHSCAFIATQDLGKVHGDGSFEILGRFDHSDLRGCNLMVL